MNRFMINWRFRKKNKGFFLFAFGFKGTRSIELKESEEIMPVFGLFRKIKLISGLPRSSHLNLFWVDCKRAVEIRAVSSCSEIVRFFLKLFPGEAG